MIKNSYQILRCNKTQSIFKLLKNEVNNDIVKKIDEELMLYHTNNKFDIGTKNNTIKSQDIVNNKYIFKSGYYFCSYIYKMNNVIYLSEPKYEYDNNPYCPREEFNNIIISNTIPLNLNIVGVIYFYKYLEDISECKSNIFTFTQKDNITHSDEEKYMIDVIYFNTLININYELNYIFHKNVTYSNIKQNTYRTNLNYINFEYNNSPEFMSLSNIIENTIYNETNQLLLQLNKSQKKHNILKDLHNVISKNPLSLKNIVSQIIDKTSLSTIESEDITENNSNLCINKYRDYLITINNINDLINKIIEDFGTLNKYILTLEKLYLNICNSVYDLNDFGNIILNESLYNSYRNIFENVIETRGSIDNENNKTIYGLKPLILKLIYSITSNTHELNNNIVSLKSNIGTNVRDINKLINDFYNTSKSFINFDIYLDILNENITATRMDIFIEYSKTKVVKKKLDTEEDITDILDTPPIPDTFIEKYIINKDKVLNKSTTHNYNIELLPEVAQLFIVLEEFKINKNNILKIYEDIDRFYSYLDESNSNISYKTLYDIFFITENNNYEDYIKFKKEFKLLQNKYTNKIKDDSGSIRLELKNKIYNLEFPKLPRNDDIFKNIYDNRSKFMILSEELIIPSYFQIYNSLLINIKKVYNVINNKLLISEKNIRNICKTEKIIDEYTVFIKSFIKNVKININGLTAQKDSKKFENLPIEHQKYIELFIDVNKKIFGTYSNYITNYEYYISNNIYSVSRVNFLEFINEVAVDDIDDSMIILNNFFTIRNCLNGQETNNDIMDEFIVIVYSFCISMLSSYPKEFFEILFYVKQNTYLNKLFSDVMHNKIYTYIENKNKYVKIISQANNVDLSDFSINNKLDEVLPKIKNIRNKLVTELRKSGYSNIRKKLAIIKYFISNNENSKSLMKTQVSRTQTSIIDDFFNIIKKQETINGSNINDILKISSYYNKNKATSNNKYCITLNKNNKYDCGPCDMSKKPTIKNLNECPVNLPYNLDSNIDTHMNSIISFGQSTYRIFSYISEKKKHLIYKRGAIKYGVPKSEQDKFIWDVNKTYKNFTLLGKTDENEDETIIIKVNNSNVKEKIISDTMEILNKKNDDFYVNNFYIQNIVLEKLLKNPNYKFPNSHQLYIKPENNYYYVYFIENDIKYYMYLNIKKDEIIYDIVFRAEDYSVDEIFIKNNSKWRFVRTDEYVEDIFDNNRTHYNIRSKIHMDINNPKIINGLLANNNTCYKYNVLLDKYFNNNFDIINNTKFSFDGYNNNYKIKPRLNNKNSIFNNIEILQFLNHNKKQFKNNKSAEKKFNKTTDSIILSNHEIYKQNLKKINDLKITFYLIKNPENETYLYLDDSSGVVDFVQLFEDDFKETSQKLSALDNVPNNFLWTTQNSSFNDEIIKNKIAEMQSKYNSMIDDSIKNIDKNLQNKISKTKIIEQVKKAESKIQTGGAILNISDDNITKINNLINKSKNIKYNDYKLLLNQLNLIKKNSKQVLDSDISYNGVNNRIKLIYTDYNTKAEMQQYVYFTKNDSRFISNTSDILNIKKLQFNLKKTTTTPLNKNAFEIILDNRELDVDNITIKDNGLYNSIEIKIPDNIDEFISRIFIYVDIIEMVINIKQTNVVVYYNINPLYTDIEKVIIANTSVNKITDLLKSHNLKRRGKNVYDFSIQLNKKDENKIYNLNENHILEYLTTYNNKISNFYLNKNKLDSTKQNNYNSKIFYISNDTNISYINIYNSIDSKEVYSVPSEKKTIVSGKINEYICENVANHVTITKLSTKSLIIRKIFDYISILYKNNKYSKLNNILDTTKNTSGYNLQTDGNIDLYIDMNKLDSMYSLSESSTTDSSGKIENKITLVFNKTINSKFIYSVVKYDEFVTLLDLQKVILNIPFTNLKSLHKNKNVYKSLFIKFKDLIELVQNVKTNKDGQGFNNIKNIIDEKDTLFSYFGLSTNDDTITEEEKNIKLKLILHNLLLSNNSLTTYIIDIVLTLLKTIQKTYDSYALKINKLLKSDNRFIHCEYRKGDIVDIFYNMVLYFNDFDSYEGDVSYLEKIYNYGFYIKNEQTEKYNNFVIDKESKNKKYLLTFENVITNYSHIYPYMTKINKAEINEYNILHKNYKNELNMEISTILNMDYYNIKLNSRNSERRLNNTMENMQQYFKTQLSNNDSSSSFMDYSNIRFNTSKRDKYFSKGDVVLFDFINRRSTNSLYNIINLIIPEKKINDSWLQYSELNELNYRDNKLYELTNKNLNIYSIKNYNKIFTSTLLDTYIPSNNLLMKEIYPYANKKDSRVFNNNCYIKIVNVDIYLYINNYKYKIFIKQLLHSNLFVIYKTINNINYYITFDDSNDDKTIRYIWQEEKFNNINNILDNLLYIVPNSNNIIDNTDKPEITYEKMYHIEYFNRFKYLFSNTLQLLDKTEGTCKLNKTYTTIHSKKYNTLIHNNNLDTITELLLHNMNQEFILKDKYSKINDKRGNYEYYINNNECVSYIIYNSDKKIICDKNFNFINLSELNVSINELLDNNSSYSDYIINLKYMENKNLFYQLDKDCIYKSTLKKLKIKNISDQQVIANINQYYIYDSNDVNIIDSYIRELQEEILEPHKSFYIIPLRNVKEKKIQIMKEEKLENTHLSLMPISDDSMYYVIRNKKNEYLKIDTFIDYKKPLRTTLKYKFTNSIKTNELDDYLWYLKNNIKDDALSNINISKISNSCMIGGNKIILNKDYKEKMIQEENKKYQSESDYKDLCNNNTYVNFIDFNMETQDNVTYTDCMTKCNDISDCVGFSVQKNGNFSKCQTYNRTGKSNSILYYDCKNSLTTTNQIGEIKNNKPINIQSIELQNLNLYKIKSIDTGKYITFDRNNVINNKNKKLYLSNIINNSIYSNHLFELNLQKNNIFQGNYKLFNLLYNKKELLGYYTKEIDLTIGQSDDSTTEFVNIIYENNKYVWKQNNTKKWYIKPTNNINEYEVIKGTSDSDYYCEYYDQGYTKMKIIRNSNKKIIKIIGPNSDIYNVNYDSNKFSILQFSKNIKKSNYQGNIFIVKNNDNYNLYTIFNSSKYYLTYDSLDSGFILFFKKLESSETPNDSKFLWSFELDSNELSIGKSYQEIVAGGDMLMGGNQPSIKGGITKNNLKSGNSYYIKSSGNNGGEYLCANRNYSINGTIPDIIAIKITNPLIVNPNSSNVFSERFIRGSIDLSQSEQTITKKYNIDDDILWKLNIQGDAYIFYNRKNDIYLNIEGENKFNITSDLSYYNLEIDKTNLGLKNSDKDDIYTLIKNDRDIEGVNWTCISPMYLKNDKNPYENSVDYSNLVEGNIYRIINQGPKDTKLTDTYLTINNMNNELLIPYNEKTFNGKIGEDPSLWKCIINNDKTYSFICMKNNKKLGNINNKTSLFRNVNNTLEFKNQDYTINKNKLTDKFYVQHSTNNYYNIINSKDLNYKMTAFSNDLNIYDNYELDNIKYTHKVANNSEWLLSCNVIEENTTVNEFSDENFYYLYPTPDDKLKYGISSKYNQLFNTFYYENTPVIINTNNDTLVDVIKKNKSNFSKYKGFTLESKINCNIKTSDIVYRKNNISVILTTNNTYYTIRFVNYDENTLLVRINSVIETNITPEKIKSKHKNFDKVDYKKNVTTGDSIDLKICAPDIYSDLNIFKLSEVDLNITYDNEFLNIYLNNKLITFTRLLNISFKNIYYTSNIDCKWKNNIWYKHTNLIKTPLWTTENIDDFIDGKPGIKFTSKINPSVKMEVYIEQDTIGNFFVRNRLREYLSVVYEENKLDYEVVFVKDKPTEYTNCLWKMFDTKQKNMVKVSKVNKQFVNKFKCLHDELIQKTNTSDNYWNNNYNSTNLMLKAKINKNTKLVDENSSYLFSVVNINSNSSEPSYKEIEWLNNANGHTAVDYSKFLLGSHFKTDLWNLQYILGIQPKQGDKFYVKYKDNEGSIVIDQIKNELYDEYVGPPVTVRAHWENWSEVEKFQDVNNQDNVYIDKIIDSENTGNICLSLNSSGTAANCSYVNTKEDCESQPESLLYKENTDCNEVLYKNYKIIDGDVMNGGQKGGSIYRQEEYFYLFNKISDKYIFNDINNVVYIPAYNETDESVLSQWKYGSSMRTKNIIYNRILNNFDYDGYIEDEKNKILRAVILPRNYVLFYSDNKSNSYIKGKMKSFNCKYKNINILKLKTYKNDYVDYYVNIQIKQNEKLVEQKQIKDSDKLSKCHDLIKKNICVPNGINTIIGNNINDSSYLLNTNDNIFQNNNNVFRIISPFGKYLCDIFVNDNHYCSSASSTELMFQKQYNSVDINQESHLIHTPSYESLWRFEYNDIENTYKIVNVYTNKNLIDKPLYISYTKNKYFKQQFIQESSSLILYNNEDLYNIYYINSEKKKIYLSYEDILINKKYHNSAKITYNKKPTDFIIKLANYNLDIITDENLEMPNKIKNICYSKVSTCDSGNYNISLLENVNIRCLDIKYNLKELDSAITYDYDLFSLLSKSNDKSLSIPNKGIYEITFYINNINFDTIYYKFSTLFKPIKISIKLNNVSVLSPKIIPNQQVSKEEVLNVSTQTENTLVFRIECDNGFTLNYIDIKGIINSSSNRYKTESLPMPHNIIKNNSPIKINKSVISKKNYLDRNLVKIKYFNNLPYDNKNNDLNILCIDNKNIKVKNQELINTNNNKHKFTLVFNPLLNAYMFYIDNNKFLNIDNKCYYFKLIESNTLNTLNTSQTKIYYLQSLFNNNLYVNINTDKSIILGSKKQDFGIIYLSENLDTDIVNIKTNSIHNNILYNPYEKVIYLKVEDTGKYSYIDSGLREDSDIVKKIVIKQNSNTSWILKDPESNSQIVINNLVNISDNKYTFTYEGREPTVIIDLYFNYNELNIRTYGDRKNNIKYNDINKTIDSTDKYEKQIIRNKKYRNYNTIIDEIYLDDVILIKNNSQYISTDGSELFLSDNKDKTNGYFIEIPVNEAENLYKLWNVYYKKFIMFDVSNSSFKLSDVIEYNNIDLFNDTNIYNVFEKTITSKHKYVMYYNSNINLNLDNPGSEMYYYTEKTNTYEDIFSNFTNYNDYCNNKCSIEGTLEDNLINNKLYTFEDKNESLYIRLIDYDITITSHYSDNLDYSDYINITGVENADYIDIPIDNFKEKNILRELFNISTSERNVNLKLKTVTVNVSIDSSVQNLYNIIIWKYETTTMGRFENKFDIPDSELYINKPIKVIYDANFNKFDFNNKSYNIVTYTNPPSDKKYIKISELNFSTIIKYNISLFHIDNKTVDVTEYADTDDKLSEIRKILTTCTWGDCSTDIKSLSNEEKKNILKTLNQTERMYGQGKLKGGLLDNNMIRFIKSSTNEDIIFNSNNRVLPLKQYVNEKLTYYDNNKLLKIEFNKNDSLEIYKVFGTNGWKNSYNSYYNKTMFSINKITDIKPIDYYNAFRNIYPVSWLEERFAYNTENLWKHNNWFEDSPHYRGLPDWKFEEVQLTSSSDKNIELFKIEQLGGRRRARGISSQNEKMGGGIILITIIILIMYLIYTLTK